MFAEIINTAFLAGRIRPYQIFGEAEPVRPLGTDWESNLVMYDWATIVGKLLTEGNTDYKVSGMYLEFENVASPGDPVSVPSYTRADGVSYFNGLSASGTKDYLRVALRSSQLSSNDETNFPGGNVMTFFAQTQGVVGVHGKTFSDSVNSKIYGGALIASPQWSDASQDLVLSRAYLSVSNQQLKTSTSQVGLEWELELG